MHWPSLHDATLRTVQLRWSDDTVAIDLIYFEDGRRRSGTIKGTGVMGLTCPRAFSWGESDAINSILLSKRDRTMVLTIEMQSGDEVSVEAKTLEFERGAPIE